MNTAPTGEQLGIIISAIEDIEEGESIVLDYDEHGDCYFESCMYYLT